MDLPMQYEIRVKGVLDGHWSAWFEGLDVQADGKDTVISGPIPDQAALHGVLAKVRDLGLPSCPCPRSTPTNRAAVRVHDRARRPTRRAGGGW